MATVIGSVDLSRTFAGGLISNMQDRDIPIVAVAAEVAPRTKASNYPEPFASRMVGREKRVLGDLFGLVNFGVNLTRLLPGSNSALRHAHSQQDEFIYILVGHPVLLTDAGKLNFLLVCVQDSKLVRVMGTS